MLDKFYHSIMTSHHDVGFMTGMFFVPGDSMSHLSTQSCLGGLINLSMHLADCKIQKLCPPEMLAPR